MPFTFSHPAAVLPLNRLSPRWVSMTGLIAGSVSPDFEYFIRMRMEGQFSHQFDALFWFCLPIGILLSFLFHHLIRDPLFHNLPQFLRARVQAFIGYDWKARFKAHWLLSSLSILLGAFSHIFIDSFTHPDGFFVERFPDLRTLVDLGFFKMPLFALFQNAGTLIGGLIVLGVIWSLPVKNFGKGRLDLRYWILLIASSSLVWGIRMAFGLGEPFHVHLVVSMIASASIGSILTSLFFRWAVAGES
ncbi:MAG: DUF4184 family protein [Flavobacteriales bacterium]